jgi:glucose-1-phosphate cytidylyltransferase
MKTIILSGGLGYRLKEETEFKPKPMVHIGNKPILWHIMKIYAHYGFNEFVIALGYKGDYIKQYFLNQKYYIHDFTLNTKTGSTRIHRDNTEGSLVDDFRITFVETGLETLPGERILRCKRYIPEGEDFMVTYGDGLCNVNIKELVTFHKKQKTIGSITGVRPRSRFGLVSVNSNNYVTRFREKPVLRGRINGGFMVFSYEFFNYLREKEMEHDAIRRIIRKKQLSVFLHDGFWHAMDTYADVENLNTFWREKPEWKVW